MERSCRQHLALSHRLHSGDFTTSHTQLGMGLIIFLSSLADSLLVMKVTEGISSSMALETIRLHQGRDELPWKAAVKTATGMSLTSMLAMEVAENVVHQSLTGGNVKLGSSRFWVAADASLVAGFVTPLPSNYIRLRTYKKARTGAPPKGSIGIRNFLDSSRAIRLR